MSAEFRNVHACARGRLLPGWLSGWAARSGGPAVAFRFAVLLMTAGLLAFDAASFARLNEAASVGHRVAVKTEKFSRSVLHVEAQVLKAAGQARCRRLVELIDYQGRVLPSRGEVGWRGTTRYGSLNAHLKSDLGRKDDVENRTAVQAAKLSARTATRAEFLAGCFAEFDPILAHIDALSFSEAPNYALIVGLLQTAMSALNCKWDHPLDWEEPTGSNTSDSLQPPPPLRQG
ncbi:Protein kinase domain-containing protein [Aphelenchoides fujianensis]|nr:Protein kinase domain-containing protein [Aphelenchoides fujianensis]